MSQVLPLEMMVKTRLARKQAKPFVSLKRLIIGNKQRCLECLGIGNFTNGRITYLMPIEKEYRHKERCSMEGRF